MGGFGVVNRNKIDPIKWLLKSNDISGKLRSDFSSNRRCKGMLTQMVWFAVEIHSITHVLAADRTRMPFFREPNHDLVTRG
jgi:hypothetical protein